jgi:hypothetical protein
MEVVVDDLDSVVTSVESLRARKMSVIVRPSSCYMLKGGSMQLSQYRLVFMCPNPDCMRAGKCLPSKPLLASSLGMFS